VESVSEPETLDVEPNDEIAMGKEPGTAGLCT
jgi:hypothetical protein